MRAFLLTLVFAGCAKSNYTEYTYWHTRNGQSLTIGQGSITYSRPTPKCRLTGTYQNLKEGRVLWNLTAGSCFFKKPVKTLCHIYTQAEPGVIGFSCQEIGVHALFERTQ